MIAHAASGWRLRALDAADEAWLRALFADARPEFTLLPDDVRTPLLARQFDWQRREYGARHPGAAWMAIVDRDGASLGKLVIDRDAIDDVDGGRAHCIVDIAVFSAMRGNGLGTAVLRACQDDARGANRTLTLAVAVHNIPARRLYERLGFVAIQDLGGGHLRMRWVP